VGGYTYFELLFFFEIYTPGQPKAIWGTLSLVHIEDISDIDIFHLVKSLKFIVTNMLDFIELSLSPPFC